VLNESLTMIALAGAWLLAAALAVTAVYMLCIVIGSWLYRVRGLPPVQRPRFAVIVPSHNEESGIADTVTRLRSALYPADLVDIFVIADNCTDRTAEMARAAGAQVMERHDLLQRGKGQALDWMLREHRELLATSDLIAFVDADMQVDPAFFTAAAAAFTDPGTTVMQGRYVVSNPRSFFAAIGYVSFCYVNHVRPAGRCFWGGTADLKGGGMVFRSAFLLPRGWPAHSIAEDIQLGKELMLEGIAVRYVPDARVESAIPSTLAQVRVQQSRWEGGRREVHASSLPRVLQSLRRQPSMLLLDGLFDLLVPQLSVVVLLGVIGIVLAWWAGSASLWIVLASLGVFAIAVLSGLLQNRAPLAVYARLLGAPVFIVWKLALLARVALSRAPAAWQRTPRDPR
jgi:1,2-diacylglycerol 3-beta-glucosyltransferase